MLTELVEQAARQNQGAPSDYQARVVEVARVAPHHWFFSMVMPMGPIYLAQRFFLGRN